jgi:hypothetical protein
MANDVPRLWLGVLDGLNSMVGAGNRAASKKGDSTRELVTKISSSPKQYKATWKQMLGDMQVRSPAHLSPTG